LFAQQFVQSETWAPAGMGKGGGHLPLHGNVVKCFVH